MSDDSSFTRASAEMHDAAAELHALRSELDAIWQEIQANGDASRTEELTRRHRLCQCEWDRVYASFNVLYEDWRMRYSTLYLGGMLRTRAANLERRWNY